MVKRFIHIITTILILIILSPVILILTLMIWVRIGEPILFKQKRAGYKENPFVLYKFRTMTEEMDKKGNLLPDKDRLAQVGKFLRKTSLDELPSLFNVLKGDMSFVGPRPLPTDYLPLYNDFQKSRHDVKPGITGWAQVNGRNKLSWEKKFELDVWYVKNRSFWLDLKIIFLTFVKVLKREGIAADGEATMPVFKGEKGI